MAIDALSRASGPTPHDATGPMGAGVTLLSPEDILAYVSVALGNIGAQLNDYKDLVFGKQKKAAALRELMGQMREMSAGGGDLKAYDRDRYDAFMTKLASIKEGDPKLEAAYNALMTSYGGYTDRDSGEVVGTLATDDGMTLGQVLDGGEAVNAAAHKKAPQGASAELSISEPSQQGAHKVIDALAGGAIEKSKPQAPVQAPPTPDTQDALLAAGELGAISENLRLSLEDLNSDNELTMMGLQQLMQQRNQISQFSSNMLNSVNEGLKSIIGNMR